MSSYERALVPQSKVHRRLENKENEVNFLNRQKEIQVECSHASLTKCISYREHQLNVRFLKRKLRGFKKLIPAQHATNMNLLRDIKGLRLQVNLEKGRMQSYTKI